MLRPGLTRFLLAFLIIIYHLSQSIFMGDFAVGCFFILSGYWISLMYEKKYSNFQNPLKVYYISRIWRLMPVFYIFTIIALIVNVILSTTLMYRIIHESFVDNLIFIISNIFIIGYSSSKYRLIGPAWSLDMEMQFYLLFPLLLYLFKKNSQNRYLKLGVVLLITASFTFYLVDVAFLKFTFFRFIYLFLTGILVYNYEFSFKSQTLRVSQYILLITVVLNITIPALAIYSRQPDTPYFRNLSFVLILLAIPSLIASVNRETNKRDKFWGEMSFVVYLSHWIWLTPYNLLIANGSKISRLPYVLGFITVTFLSSYLIYKFIDRPSEKIRQRWIKKQLLKPILQSAPTNSFT